MKNTLLTFLSISVFYSCDSGRSKTIKKYILYLTALLICNSCDIGGTSEREKARAFVKQLNSSLRQAEQEILLSQESIKLGIDASDKDKISTSIEGGFIVINKAKKSMDSIQVPNLTLASDLKEACLGQLDLATKEFDMCKAYINPKSIDQFLKMRDSLGKFQLEAKMEEIKVNQLFEQFARKNSIDF